MSQSSYFADFCRECWLALKKRTRPDGDSHGQVCSVCGKRTAGIRAEVWDAREDDG